jgi:hypothetical protein
MDRDMLLLLILPVLVMRATTTCKTKENPQTKTISSLLLIYVFVILGGKTDL